MLELHIDTCWDDFFRFTPKTTSETHSWEAFEYWLEQNAPDIETCRLFFKQYWTDLEELILVIEKHYDRINRHYSNFLQAKTDYWV